MEHSTRYAFMGEARLAKDCGVSIATISRLMSGKSCPSYPLSVRIAQAFEKQFKKHIDVREIISLDGEYPTPNVCELVGCNGCTSSRDWHDEQFIPDEQQFGKEDR
jgi:transcriptional regulator with XRE-family HTH domain